MSSAEPQALSSPAPAASSESKLGAASRWPADALASYRLELTFIRRLQAPVPATRALLWMLVGIAVAGLLFGELVVQPRFGELGEGLDPTLLFAAKINAEVNSGAYWRLLTHTFVHGGWLHLAFNAYALLVLGSLTERMLGTRRFIVLYGLSGLAGALASYVFNDVPSVGASGAIFGVFGAAVVFGFKQRRVLPARVAKAMSTGLLQIGRAHV